MGVLNGNLLKDARSEPVSGSMLTQGPTAKVESVAEQKSRK